jgi:multidrug resistance efflux pump
MLEVNPKVPQVKQLDSSSLKITTSTSIPSIIQKEAGTLSSSPVSRDSETPIQKPPQEAKKKSKINLKSTKNYIIYAVLIICLFIPFNHNVGGEIEIEGSTNFQQAVLRPGVGGLVEAVHVQTGQKVKAGTAIVTLKNWDLEEKRLETEKQIDRLQANVISLRAQSSVAKAEYRRAYEDYKRQKAEKDYLGKQAGSLNSTTLPPRLEATRKQLEQIALEADGLEQRATLHKYLAEEGVFPSQSAMQSEYEAQSAGKRKQSLEAQLAAEKAELEERSYESTPKTNVVSMAAEANKQRVNSANAETYGAQIQIAGLKKQLALYDRQLDSLVLRSPIDGVVLTLKVNQLIGQNFNRGDTVAVVGNLSQVEVKLLLPEENIAYIQKGNSVNVRVKGVPQRAFEGKVRQIAPVTSETGEQINKKRIFEVLVLMDNKDGSLKPGMTGYAIIHTDKKKSVVELSWDEIYRVFRLDRYIDRNPFATSLEKVSHQL